MQKAQKPDTERSKHNFPAFTLAEMILVVALTLFLLVVTVQGFVNSASQFGFANAAEKVQEMIRQARSLAISGKAQPDYTDFNGDGCFDSTNPANDPVSCAGGDVVTPAHYGVNFSNNGGVYTVTLFVDNHSPADEGAYSKGANVTDYRNGKDIILETYELPSGMQMVIPQQANGSTNPGNGASATIFFLPIFADISSDVSIPSADPFFRFGISATFGDIVRKRCSQIHMLAGISEPMNDVHPAEPAVCSSTT